MYFRWILIGIQVKLFFRTNMMRQLVMMGLLLLLATCAHAQGGQAWEEYFSRRGQPEDAESGSWEQVYEELGELAARRMDLNRCTREDLRRLPFLSEQQIMDLMEYRDRARRIETEIELRLIPSWEKQDIDLLMQFVEIRPEMATDTVPSLKNLLKHGRHELVGTLKLPFYDRKGDENGYLGYKYKHWLRYTFTAGTHVRAGLVASQDAGEPFFAGRNAAGYDFYSFYVMLRDMGRVKALALGRYRLRFGMGLVMNNSFGLGKLTTLSMLGRQGSHIVAHGSRSEGNYLQGGAATVALARGLDLTAFASWRRVDATLDKETGTVTTLLKTGYHRTESEMARRRNTSQTLLGAHVNYFNSGFHVGATALFTSFSRELRPNTSQRYRAWYPSGSRFRNMSMDYGYISDRLTISGETATDNGGAVSTINSISYRVTSSLSLMALQRYYPYRYNAIFGESFAEGGRVNNESGVYVGGYWVPMRGMNLTFYTDFAYFAWPKYRASVSSGSFDNFVQMACNRKNWDFLVRYRFRMREMDNADKSALQYRNEHRGRLAVGYDGGAWTSKTQADLSFCRFRDRSLGYMLTENVSYSLRRLHLYATIGYFHTDDYNSRVYVYEKGMLYDFSFPMFYGEGLRCAVNARADFGRKAVFMAKIGTTRYFDRYVIGSGLQKIQSDCMTDLEVQLRLKL